MIYKASLTHQESTPKTRELSIQLPKVKGDCITVLLDLFVPNYELDDLINLVNTSFRLSIGDVANLMTETGKFDTVLDASFNTEKKYFLYIREENEVVLLTARINIFQPVSIDYLEGLRGKVFAIKFN